MRVLCLNGWGGRLHDRLFSYLKETDPDVLCLQEVVHAPSSPRDWLTYRDSHLELPQRAHFFTEVSQVLPDHQAAFCPATQGELWDGKTRHAALWGLATFVRRSIPIIGQRHDFVHGTFSADGYGEHPRPRTAHVVRLFDLDNGYPIVVGHMHGLRDLNGKQDTPARRVQAQKLVDLVTTVAARHDRLIVCGDFNVLPDSVTFDILSNVGLIDLVTRHGFSDTRSSHYKKDVRYADYMLVNAAVKVASFDVVATPEVSDHRPLLLELE
ncbi:MAG: endonuclease/exonuclease/phosphatase family protein [Pseudomonadota bacterium]